MSKEKTVNYTSDMEKRLAEVYTSANDDVSRKEAVENLANELNKTSASVRAKLSIMGIYVKPKRRTKDGSEIVRKDDLVERIANNMGTFSDSLPGLEKANKSTLKALVEFTSPSEDSEPR